MTRIKVKAQGQGKLQLLALSFPLVGVHARVADALEEARRKGAAAVVSSDGKEFWLHTIVDLEAAKHPTKTLQDFQQHPLPVLNAQRALNMGLDLTQLDDDKVRSVFTSADGEAMVTSIGVDFAGDRTVMALTRPDGMFKVVSKVWYCPEDKTERFWSPGICPVHGCELKQA